MLIVFYVLLVWLKVIIGTGIVFFWLWLARDRGASGVVLVLHAVAAVIVWAAPWLIFLRSRAELYRGKCGLRLGIRDCGLVEYLWGEMQWFRLGLLLDVLLLVGVLFIVFRARPSNGTNSGALSLR
jgi:hypothetical protein